MPGRGKWIWMHYIAYAGRSPKLILQLLLTLLLAVLIGGAGLIGLHSARDTITNTADVRMPALVNLLDTERYIAQTDYYGSLMVNSLIQGRSAKTAVPQLQAMSASAVNSFRAYQAADQLSGQGNLLEAQVADRLKAWLAYITMSKQLATSSIPVAEIEIGLRVADTTAVAPLMSSLSQLVRLNETDARAQGHNAVTATGSASAVLIAVIVLAITVVGSFQIGIGVREHRRRTLTRQSTDLVTLIDANGSIVYSTPTWKRMLGYTDSNASGRSLLDLIHPADRAEAHKNFQLLLAGATLLDEAEGRVRCADGRYRWFASTAINELRDPLIRGIVLTSRDVTQRKETETALRASEARLHAAISHAPIALFATDRLGTITFYEGVPLGGHASAPYSPVGEPVDEWFGRVADARAFKAQASVGAPFSTLVETGGEAYEVWWIPEQDAAGEFAGGTGVAALVTDTVRARHEAEHAQAAAIELARLRNDFVASVSHELRTPLTSILGYGELLQMHWDRFDDAQRRERLGRIMVSANRQKSLVEDLLALTRLDDGREMLPAQPLRLAGMLESVVHEIQGTYPGQRIDVCGAEDLLARADGDRTVRILTNMVDNAAKYSPEGSPIQVEWTRSGGDVVIRVRDFGRGIPDEYRDDLFTRFGRIPGSRIRSGHVGTGLGLYLGRQLARAMSGELDLETTSSRGSIFRLRLPAV